MSQVPGSWNTHVTWRMAFPRVSVCVCIMCVGTRSVTDAYCGEMRGGRRSLELRVSDCVSRGLLAPACVSVACGVTRKQCKLIERLICPRTWNGVCERHRYEDAPYQGRA